MSLSSSLGSIIVRPRLPSDLQVISLPLVMSDNEQQSDDVDNSRSKSPLNHDSSDARRDRSRSASGSRRGHRRHKSHKRSRRHSRSRSRSRSRASSRGTEKIRHYINESLISALQPLQQQIASLSGAAPSPASSIEYQELRKQQQELAIETKSATLTSSGAQSQYRCLATINLNLNAAVEAIDELLISRPSPDDPVYLALAPIHQSIGCCRHRRRKNRSGIQGRPRAQNRLESSLDVRRKEASVRHGPRKAQNMGILPQSSKRVSKESLATGLTALSSTARMEPGPLRLFRSKTSHLRTVWKIGSLGKRLLCLLSRQRLQAVFQLQPPLEANLSPVKWRVQRKSFQGRKPRR